MDTIGYGLLSPMTWGCDVLTMMCSIMANFFWCWFCGLVFAKMSFPKKLKHTHKYSDVAVMNRQMLIYKGDEYLAGHPSITFRVSGTYSSSELCDGNMNLVYFRTKTTIDGWEDYEFHELDFEINRQTGRAREMRLSTPLLALPWTVTHPIDEHSPLYRKSLEDMAEENGEIIVVIDGIDEISSQSYQSRWSYIAKEILAHREFLPCVRRGEGCFVVDFSDISRTVGIDEKHSTKSVQPVDELITSEDLETVRAPTKYLSGPIEAGKVHSPGHVFRRSETK